MTELILWLLFLGRGDIFSGDVTTESVHLPNCETPLQVLAFLLLAVVAVGVVVHFYRREPDYVAARRKRLLVALRALAMLVLIFILTGAYLEVSLAEESSGTLVVLVDTSQSMGIADRRTEDEEFVAPAKVLGLDPSNARDRETINKTSRFELVKQAIVHPKLGLRDRVSDEVEIIAYPFGQESTVGKAFSLRGDDPFTVAEIGAPTDEATQFGSALRDVMRKLKGQHILGIIALTDGGSNRGEDPVIAAGDLGVPVYPVGVGLPQAKDIEIPFMLCETVVFKGDTFPIYVRVKQRGYAGHSVQLVIKQDDEVVKERTVEFGDEDEQTVTVEITPQEEGTFTFTAEIEPLENEMSADNNRRERPGVRVVDKKIQVLMVEDAPRWEYRFIKGVLEADDKRIEPTFILRQADEDLIRERGGRFRALFPETIEELRPFNLVILGNITEEFFTGDELKALEEYVRIEGGALLVIAGPNYMPDGYGDTPLADMLPIQFQRQPEFSAEDELLGTIRLGFRPQLTPEGKRSSVLRFSADPLENETLWERVTPLYWYYPADRLKPGATALLVHPTEGTRHGQLPLIAQQRYGKGQVLFFGIDGTWRWRYKPGSEYHRRLWGQAITFLSMAHLLGKTNRIQIESDRAEYAVGDKVKIIARILDENYSNLVAPSAIAVIERGDLMPEQVVLTAQKDQPGMFQGEYQPQVEGRFRVTIKDEEDEAEHYFAAVRPRIEFDDPGLRVELLKQVAEASGGVYVSVHEIHTLAEKISRRKRTLDPRREERPLWNAPGILLLITLFLGLEWLIRKRSDLL